MPKRGSTLSKRVNRLEKVSRPEVKHESAESGAFDTIGSTTGTLLRPQVLEQGTGRNRRIGDKVKTRNIRFQAIVKMPNSASNNTCAVRFLILRSKLTKPDTSLVGTGDFPSWYGSVDEDKFFVIKDVLTQVSIVARSAGDNNVGSTMRKLKFNVPTGLRKLQYDDGSNEPPLNNEYVIYMIAENTSAEIAYNWQHYYLDN